MSRYAYVTNTIKILACSVNIVDLELIECKINNKNYIDIDRSA